MARSPLRAEVGHADTASWFKFDFPRSYEHGYVNLRNIRQQKTAHPTRSQAFDEAKSDNFTWAARLS
jgi:hypothetical protein